MVKIPFPRIDLDNDPDLLAWRGGSRKDWGMLKDFLAKQTRLVSNIHPIPKCWYSELPQGDIYALDVEHFRPKAQADPLRYKDVKEIETKAGVPFRQNIALGGKYPWLERDYRNYRLVTALTNRGGGKHVYFPILEKTIRLMDPQLPWQGKEYSLFLDPTDPYDANLLTVLPSGEICPRAPKAPIIDADIAGLPGTWKNDSFNYIRAYATIVMFRLDEKVFIDSRKEVYESTTKNLEMIYECIKSKTKRKIKENFIEALRLAALPSAPLRSLLVLLYRLTRQHLMIVLNLKWKIFVKKY